MSPETHEPNERLSRAIAEFQQTSVNRAALDRGEDAVLRRVPARNKSPRRSLLWAAGLGTVAVVTAFLSMPSESFAAELKRIGANGDKVLHHVRQYEVSKDGKYKLVLESYSANGRTKLIYATGEQSFLDNGSTTTLYTNGAAVTEARPDNALRTKPDSATDILNKNATGPGVKVSVQRAVSWNGLKVDRYTVDRAIVDGQGDTLQLHMILTADPKTERPLEMQADLTGFPRSVVRWDYPASDPSFLELHIKDKSRLYDVNAERLSILGALKETGRKVVVGDQIVELLQLWVDEEGEACAIARASYAYPSNYGIKIDDLDMKSGEEADQLTSTFSTPQPTMYDGRSVQLFFTYREPNAGPMNYRKQVTVKVPVFSKGEFVGYALFDKVPVLRAWSVRMLLEPMNVPFWTEPKTDGAPTARSD